MTRTRFIPNRRFQEELARDPGVRRVLEGKAEQALTAVQGIAASYENTGANKASFSVDGPSLVTDDRAAWLIEFGSVNNPPYAPLRKAGEAVGAKVVFDRG